MTRVGFTGAPIDRADPVRSDPARLDAVVADPRARLLGLEGLDPVASADLTLITRAPMPAANVSLALLGIEEAGPLFVALGEPISAEPPDWATILALASGEMALYAAARSLVAWHARHGFCANCGHATAPFRAGWGRACPACGTEHFPRVDPVVIMLAEHGDRVLVGRQARFPPGRYSALAGFVEPGESVEEAVARELHEEAGIAVANVRYLASQPWPFPSQLMIACIATAADDALTIDMTELEDARWMTREEVRAALAGDAEAPFEPPPPHAIARTLLEAWAGC